MTTPLIDTDRRPAASQGDPAPIDGELRVSPAELARLPAKLQWPVVAHYRAQGDFDDAETLLDEIEARSGETARLLDERARLAFAAGEPDAALARLEARAARFPCASAEVALARLHLDVGHVAAAAEISAALLQSDPDLVTVAGLAAEVARANGDFAAARAHYQGVLSERPDNTTALFALAHLALDEGNPSDAASLVDHALTVAGDALTPGQLASAIEVTELVGQFHRADELRERATHMEVRRNATLLASVREALGESTAGVARSRNASPPRERRSSEADSSESERSVELEADPELESAAPPLLAATVSPDELDPAVLAALERDFGFAALRPGQAGVIAGVLDRRDTLAIMPTGSGKSLTFQLPAMLLDGTTLVISPLIALMKDQVDSLPAAVRDRTALINSTLSPLEMRQRLDELADGAYKLVYAAPERLRQHAFLRALRAAGTALVVIDEAHCITMWGHDFRPDYLTIPKALPELGDPPVLAITATATPAMARAIGTGLGRDLSLVQISLFRPNLFYEVHRLANREEKVAKVIEICRQDRGAGIVYVSSRKDAEAIAGLLRDRGVGAVSYHAGLDPHTRAHNQERFMSGGARVVVATVAFGMGVNKADVRFIVHLNPPRSLEAYAQESGRAGRDGRPARCVLLTAAADQANLTRLARRDETDLGTLRRIYAGLQRAAAGRWAIVDPNALIPPPGPEDDGADDPDPRIALGLLEQAGFVHRHPDVPVTRSLRRLTESIAPADDDLTAAERDAWERLSRWSGLDVDRWGVSFRTAEACAALDLAPAELDRLLGRQTGYGVVDGPRTVCLELLPIRGDATKTMTDLLDRARREAQRRIAQVMAYAAGGSCRHATLAAQFGETLPPCDTVCDVCTGAATATRSRRVGATNPRAAATAPQRSQTNAADAQAVLLAVKTLPFPMGKTGLAKLLAGSVESRVRADRSPAFGALADVRRARIEALIDQLVADELLFRDVNHEFKLIRLTPRGAQAAPDDLADYDPPPVPVRRQPSPGEPRDEAPRDADLEALIDRLRDWRRERALNDAVPPYVVAHDSMLRDLALARPQSAEGINRVKGFGPSRVEKYGDELLAILAE